MLFYTYMFNYIIDNYWNYYLIMDINKKSLRLKSKEDNLDLVVKRYVRIKRKKFFKKFVRVISFNCL